MTEPVDSQGTGPRATDAGPQAEGGVPEAESRSLESLAREVFQELVMLDTAVYQAIEATPTPLIDAPLRRLSNSANHAKLYMGIAAVLFAVGGKKGRRAAVTGHGRRRAQLVRRQRPDEVRWAIGPGRSAASCGSRRRGT